jgi:hypothetical protein
MVPFATGVWRDTNPVSFLGLRLTVTMTVLDLGGGELLLHSPLPLTSERRTAVEMLGHVAHLYAPNTFHYLWVGEWIAAFPEARVHAPAALGGKRKELRIDRFHDETSLVISNALVEIPIHGFRMAETVLVHRPSGTAIVTDLVHNVGRPTHFWTKLYATAFGFYDRVAQSRVIRWTAYDDRAAARRSVDALLAQPFERLIVGHGDPLTHGAHALLAMATAWLPSARPQLTAGATRPLFGKPCG